LNSLNATTSKPERCNPRVSPPHPENRDTAFILILQLEVQYKNQFLLLYNSKNPN
jgi:hypothetical protein